MRKWYSFSEPGSTALRCAACGQTIELGPMADHHPGRCPKCETESAFLNWQDEIVQVIPRDAPAPFTAFLRWAQEHLDELEYVELVCSFEELAEARLGATAASVK